MKDVPPVLLTGATAQVGLHVLRDLLVAGVETHALSRKVTASEQISHPSGTGVTWHQPERYRALIGNEEVQAEADFPLPECLISAGPIELAEQWLERLERLERIVCLSTSSVFSKADSALLTERAQMKAILQSEERLMSTCSARNIGLVILRPTLIYGCGLDENISRLAKFIARFDFVPLAGKATGLRQPIHVADLAQLMVTIALARISGQSTFEVAGGSTLTYRDMTARVFKALSKPERMISLPPALLAGSVAIARELPGMRSLNPQMVLRQNQDLIFSDTEIRQRFNFQPREFRPSAKDFELPVAMRQLLPSLSAISR